MLKCGRKKLKNNKQDNNNKQVNNKQEKLISGFYSFISLNNFVGAFSRIIQINFQRYEISTFIHSSMHCHHNQLALKFT